MLNGKKTEVNTSKEKEIKDKWDKIPQEEETWEQKQMASLQKALLEMTRAAELNLAAIEKINNFMEENPSIGFLKALFKPVYDIVQNDKLKCMVDKFNVAKFLCLGQTKYVSEVVSEKTVPLKLKENGKLRHKCPICGLIKVSWSAVDGQIKYGHFNQAHSCPNFMKKCKSIDGIRKHTKNCKIMNKKENFEMLPKQNHFNKITWS